MLAIFVNGSIGFVLLAGAILKLIEPADALVQNAAALGVPGFITRRLNPRVFSLCLVSAETAIAIGLQVNIIHRTAAIAAAAFFSYTALLLGIAAAKKTPVNCCCFGLSSARVVTKFTVGRNVGAALLSWFLACGILPNQALSQVGSWAMVSTVFATAFAFAFWTITRERGGVVNRSTASNSRVYWNWELAMTDGTILHGRQIETAKRIGLLFTDPRCSACHLLEHKLRSVHANDQNGTQLLIISRGSPYQNSALAKSVGANAVGVQDDFEVARRFGISGTPAAVLLEKGTIVLPVAIGTAQVGEFLNNIEFSKR